MAEKKKAVAKQVPVKLATAEEKKKALDAAIAHIEKQYGKGAVMKLGDDSARMKLTVDRL